MADIPDNSIAAKTVVVIMAAGKGSRMGRSDLGKVCFEIDSVPAINRIIAVFKKLRFRRFLLVVGSKAQQVLDTVAGQHPDVTYVYQMPQLGTGHAAKVASEVLENLDYQGNVLVTMGDKLIEPEALEALVDGFTRQQADLALLTIPRTKATEGSVGSARTVGPGVTGSPVAAAATGAPPSSAGASATGVSAPPPPSCSATVTTKTLMISETIALAPSRNSAWGVASCLRAWRSQILRSPSGNMAASLQHGLGVRGRVPIGPLPSPPFPKGAGRKPPRRPGRPVPP